MSRLAILFAAGTNLVLLQVVMIRELASVFFCAELVILAVTVAYFVGCSLGYLVSERMDARLLVPWIAAVLALHLPLVAGVRVLVVCLGETQLAPLGLPVVLVFAAVGLTSFYTVLLPRMIAGDEPSSQRLARCYSAELAGGACGGLGAFVVGGALGFAWLAFVYQALLVCIAHLLGCRKRTTVLLAAGGLAVLACMPAIERWSTELLYERTRGIEGATLLHREVSPYQKIEVFEALDGERSLYLNGLEYYNSRDLEWFNGYLSGVPARLRPGASVLVVGSGSMSSVAHLAPHVQSITTVEIDAAVARVGREHFADRNRLDELEVPWRLVIDDAKHFLATTEERFDVIIVDVPAPWYVQTGTLFTVEFYRLARARLARKGLLSVYLTEAFRPGSVMPVGSQVLAALAQEFAGLVVIDAPESPYGFALASPSGNLDPDAVRRVLRAERPGATARVFTRPQVLAAIAGAPPASYDNMNIVWHLNVEVLAHELGR